MKRFLSMLALAAIASVALWSCADQDEERPISVEDLPQSATKFIEEYYAGVQAVSVVLDKDDGTTEYEVVLSNGHQLTFSKSGEWKDVDAPYGQVLPSGFILPEIVSYVQTNYPEAGINEISREFYGFDVDLTNDIDLRFAFNGTFLGIDR